MASVINTVLGFSFNDGILKSIVGNLNEVRHAAVSVSSGIADINKRIKSLASVQSIAALGLVMKNTAGSVKSLAMGVKNIFDKTRGFADRGDKISKTSRLLGLSVEEYQALGSAAQHSGMSVEEMDASLSRFTVNLAKARAGDKTTKKMFDSILPKGSKLSDYKTTSSLISAIADSYTKLGSAEQKAFASQELFGKSGLKMSELLSGGSAGIQQMIADFNENGGGFNQTGAENAALFNDELQKTQESISAIATGVMQELFPTFIAAFKEIRSYLKENGETLKSTFTDIGKQIVNFIKDILPKIPGWIDRIISVIDFIGPKMAAVIGIVVAVAPVVVNITMALISLWKVLSVVFSAISTIFTYLSAIKTIVMATASFIGAPILAPLAAIVAFIISMVAIVKQFYDNWDMWCSFVNHELTDAVNDWIDMFVEDVKWLWNGFKSIFIDPFLNFFKALPDAFSKLWDGFKNGVSQIGSFIYNTFFGAISGAINAAKGLLSSLPLVGSLFASDGPAPVGSAPSNVAAAVQQSYTTTTSRFAVDFNNVPRGATITPPAQGDFDWSRSYTLAGGV